MKNINNDLLTTTISASILFFILVAFIITYFIIYRRKRQKHSLELRLAREEYEKQVLQMELEIQEQIFSDISEEIHDNVGQVLSLAKLQLALLREGENIDKLLLTQPIDNIQKAIQSLRNIAKSLNSDRILQMPFEDTIYQEVQQIKSAGLFTVDLTIEGKIFAVDEKKKLILLRIFQETLQNIIKHANADTIQVSLSYSESQLRIMVQDNGCGFQMDKLKNKDDRGLGLQNMHKRAALIGSQFIIDSTVGQGTTVQMTITQS